MLMSAVIVSHSCGVRGNGRRAIGAADDAQYIIALIISKLMYRRSYFLFSHSLSQMFSK